MSRCGFLAVAVDAKELVAPIGYTNTMTYRGFRALDAAAATWLRTRK